MEDDLHYKVMEEDLNIKVVEDDLNFKLMEDDHNLLAKGRQPQFCCWLKTTYMYLKIEDNHSFLLGKASLTSTSFSWDKDFKYSLQFWSLWLELHANSLEMPNPLDSLRDWLNKCHYFPLNVLRKQRNCPEQSVDSSSIFIICNISCEVGNWLIDSLVTNLEGRGYKVAFQKPFEVLGHFWCLLQKTSCFKKSKAILNYLHIESPSDYQTRCVKISYMVFIIPH